MPDTGTPPVRNSAKPKPIDCTPSVTMKGDTPITATPKPLTRPTTSPASIPQAQPTSTTIQAASGKAAPSACMASAETTEVIAITVPTERSKPPVTSASIWPSDTRMR